MPRSSANSLKNGQKRQTRDTARRNVEEERLERVADVQSARNQASAEAQRLDGRIDDRYTKSEVYTKAEDDAFFANRYTKSDSDGRYYTKTDAALGSPPPGTAWRIDVVGLIRMLPPNVNSSPIYRGGGE